MGIHIAATTQKGLKSQINQDAVFAKTWILANQHIGMIAVADGLGGHAHGEIAARLAIKRLTEWVNAYLHEAAAVKLEDLDAGLNQVFAEIHALIERQNRSAGHKSGTTLTVCMCVGRHYILKNVGDTRCYFFDGQTLSQRSTDDTWVADQVQKNLLSFEAARYHARRNALIQCLGMGPYHQPHTQSGEIEMGQAVFICSDGFYSKLNDVELLEAVAAWMNENANPLDYLHERFLNRAVTDDISIALICY